MVASGREKRASQDNPNGKRMVSEFPKVGTLVVVQDGSLFHGDFGTVYQIKDGKCLVELISGVIITVESHLDITEML